VAPDVNADMAGLVVIHSLALTSTAFAGPAAADYRVNPFEGKASHTVAKGCGAEGWTLPASSTTGSIVWLNPPNPA
jgi:hypothetical protein